jgi:hypothetical protein
MKLFFKYIGENLRLYPQVRLTKTDEVLIRNSAMSHLGLINLNQMRDRYEGQAFFEKTMKNIGGLMALQKHLNLELIDSDKVNLGDFHPYIKLDGKKVNINVFDFGSLPIIKIKDIKNPVFFIIQKDSLTFLLCGLGTKEVIKNNLIESTVVQSNTDKYMDYYCNFRFLNQTSVERLS